MIYEVRNYHVRPDALDAYVAWTKAEALPHLSSEFDLVGFWVNSDDPGEVRGEPQDHLGPANITWIIRWQDMVQRNEVLPRVLAGPMWQDIFSRIPGGRVILQRVEVKFANSLM